MLVRPIAFGILAAVVSPLSPAAVASPCASPDACIAAIARTQDARVEDALERIPGTGAKLLALRSYLRTAAGLAQRWSWTQAQIASFAGSPHEQELNGAIERVQHEFERANPGFSLSVNPEVRSFERQLEAWSTNDSVAAAAREFNAAAISAMQPTAASRRPGTTPQAFARFVMDHQPRPSPTLAAPGLSRHGQMYAVDFHVRSGESTVADADSATIASVWVVQGWEQKLRAAVVASGGPFAGPLQEPHEPWHYEYTAPRIPPDAARPH